MSAPANRENLLAAEWKRARDSRILAAWAIQDEAMKRALIWAARRANHELIKLRTERS